MKLKCRPDTAERSDNSNWLRLRRLRHWRRSSPACGDVAVTMSRILPSASGARDYLGGKGLLTPQVIDAATSGVHHAGVPDRRRSPMSDIEATVETYLAMWNEPDPALRAELIERAWTTEAHYVDPVLEATGYEGLSDMVDRV